MTSVGRLSRRSNEELAKLALEGDESARDELILNNKGIVWLIAKSVLRIYQKPFLIEDFVQSGFIGLIYAIKRYDPSLGLKFTTYASYWIRREIYQEIEKSGSSINFPIKLYQYERKYSSSKAKINKVNVDMITLKDPTLDDPDRRYMDQEELEKLRRNINRLKPRGRDVLNRWLAGESFQSIGKSFGVSETYTRELKRSAVDRLRELW